MRSGVLSEGGEVDEGGRRSPIPLMTPAVPPRPPASSDLLALARSGMAALAAGDPAAAEQRLGRVAAEGRPDASVWTALAMARLQLGRADTARAAVDQALALEPRSPRALITAADVRLAQNDLRGASTFYKSALLAAPATAGGDLAAELSRARQALADLSAAFERRLMETVAAGGYDPERAQGRARHALELLTGKRRVFQQQPLMFYFPELPQRQFYEREEFPWLPELEARTEAIRAELLALLEDGDAFAPYLQRDLSRPALEQAALEGSRDWSAFFLWKNGALVEENAARCPATMDALTLAPLARTPGRTPSVLFSQLRPGARIAPHNGYVNTRLICHLPLIVPEGCGLRVGNETRSWREGETLIFDDSIEHEAWNTGGRTRVVLLFDIWRPELSADERVLVSAALHAAQTLDGGGPEWTA